MKEVKTEITTLNLKLELRLVATEVISEWQGFGRDVGTIQGIRYHKTRRDRGDLDRCGSNGLFDFAMDRPTTRIRSAHNVIPCLRASSPPDPFPLFGVSSNAWTQTYERLTHTIVLGWYQIDLCKAYRGPCSLAFEGKSFAK